jgi:hypothetical protein
MFYHPQLRVQLWFALRGLYPFVSAVRQHAPGLHVVFQMNVKDVIAYVI